MGGADNEVLSNLVTHVVQLTKQLTKFQGTINVVQTSPWELCKFCGDGTVVQNVIRDSKQ